MSRAISQRQDGEWLVETYALPRARLGNRQNGGADLRLVLPDRQASVRSITLRR